MKRKKIIYWASTIFLSVAMIAGGIQQMLQIGGYVDIVVTQLGYPIYFLSIIGTWKILGVIAILVPGRPILKEWAYAGFFFVMSGALFSHLFMKQSITDILPSLILLLVILTSWYFRPYGRISSFYQHHTV